jgi:hypothetical protein
MINNLIIESIGLMTSDGLSFSAISEKLNIPVNQVKEIINNNNFNLNKVTFSENLIPEIIILYSNGASAKNLGFKFSIDKRRIIKWAKEAGLARSKSESNRKHLINENIFDQIDQKEKAYWLGFLYSDAHLSDKNNSITVTVPTNKRNHLEKFSLFMGADKRIIKSIKDDAYSVISIGNKHIVEKLINLGFGKKKDKNFNLAQINSTYQSYFILGYFDGKGCLTQKKNGQWKLHISGKNELLNQIIDFFAQEDLKLDFDPWSKTNSIYANGNLKINKILGLLYHSCIVCLDHNYLKYQEIKRTMHESHRTIEKNNYRKPIEVGGQLMNTAALKTMPENNRKELLEPIVNKLMDLGFIYPDDDNLLEQYNDLVECQVDLTTVQLNNQHRLGNSICRYFCHSFFHSKTREECSIFEAYGGKEKITKVVSNKLLDGRGSYNFSPMTMIDEVRDMRLSGYISLFKPAIAKYICLKYSNPGDVVGDYSSGFGGRLLGAMSCGRKYIGTDPLTAVELQNMINYFNFKDCEVIQIGSEYYRGEENSVDLYWSSPPYYDLEIYSDSLSQSYNKGINYFYNKYWRDTLENIKWMLKPGKYFGVNVSAKYYKMVEIAKEYFGEIVEEINLVSMRYHFNGNKVKSEKIYMFKNNK